MKQSKNSYRVLVIDDNEAIHADIRKVLASHQNRELEQLTSLFLDKQPDEPPESTVFEIVSAYQGKEGCEQIESALREKRPFAVAYVDMRMPPGWDGLETIDRIWQIDPTVQVVICSAYAEESWESVTRKLGRSDGTLILKKPFDVIAARQCARVLARKWALEQAA